jgi:hypothetical protein
MKTISHNITAAAAATATTTTTVAASSTASALTSIKPTAGRERRIVGGGQQHPQTAGGAGVHSRSHSSAYKQYYINTNKQSNSSGTTSRQRTHGGNTYAWLRNPFVVFFMSFFALGSLRFRVRNHQHSLATTNNRDHSSTRTRTSVSQKLRNIPHAVGERLNKGNSDSSRINNINQAITRTVVATALEANIEEIHQRGINNTPINKKQYPIAAMSSTELPATTTKTPPSASDVEFEYVLVEEGKLYKEQPHGGPSFQRFAVQEKATERRISVQEWTRLMLEDHRKNMNNHQNNKIMVDFIRTLKNAPYAAYFFETKGVDTTAAAKKAFEFVLVEAPALHRFASQTARRAANKALSSSTTTTAAAAAAAAVPTSTSILLLLAAQVPFYEQFSSKTCESSSSSSSSSSSLSGDDDDMACVFDNLSGDATLISPKPMFTAALATKPAIPMAVMQQQQQQQQQYQQTTTSWIMKVNLSHIPTWPPFVVERVQHKSKRYCDGP